ncbi:Arm DNA-binding domain-containing protein [Psychrobacter sp. NPDC077938]|uniref:Arm DNA-binding domain-containing protein n=1 Tax=Psychrobacter sp. NPDC077938 TaxID=3364494 RepID=UPI0037CB1F6A
MPLTHTVINKLQPSSTSIDTKRPDKHSDGNGLQLWVRYTGVKSWISAYRWQGKQQTLTIGNYRDIVALHDTTILDLQTEIWHGSEPLTGTSPRPYPIDAFTGLLQYVVKAVAHYTQAPTAITNQCVLGALAYMGQGFIDTTQTHANHPNISGRGRKR